MTNRRRTGWLAALLFLLAGAWAFAQAPAQSPAERLDALVKRYDAAMQEFYAKVRAEEDEQAQMKLWESRPGKEFVPEFKALALEAKGTPTAVEAWMQVIQVGGDFDLAEDVNTAIETLMREHIDSPDLGQLAWSFQSMAWRGKREEGLAGLRKLAEKSPHKPVQAAALFGLGEMLMQGGDAEKAEGRTVFERIIKDYAGVKPKRGAAFDERAKGFLFELDHLQVGMVAPDFESIDENGQKFKIGDYRGKVVVLDFWGFW